VNERFVAENLIAVASAARQNEQIGGSAPGSNE
jgi:hypothetical protein